MNEPEKWSMKLEKLCTLLSSAPRCRILRELTLSEWLPVSYLAARAGISRTAASQHMALLKKLKVVEGGVGRLYRLVPALRPPPGAEWLDFGYMRLKLPPPPVARPTELPVQGVLP